MQQLSFLSEEHDEKVPLRDLVAALNLNPRRLHEQPCDVLTGDVLFRFADHLLRLLYASLAPSESLGSLRLTPSTNRPPRRRRRRTSE